jgi:hypothetical protein
LESVKASIVQRAQSKTRSWRCLKEPDSTIVLMVMGIGIVYGSCKMIYRQTDRIGFERYIHGIDTQNTIPLIK